MLKILIACIAAFAMTANAFANKEKITYAYQLDPMFAQVLLTSERLK